MGGGYVYYYFKDGERSQIIMKEEGDVNNDNWHSIVLLSLSLSGIHPLLLG